MLFEFKVKNAVFTPFRWLHGSFKGNSVSDSHQNFKILTADDFENLSKIFPFSGDRPEGHAPMVEPEPRTHGQKMGKV